MEHIKSGLEALLAARSRQKKRLTERGELMRYFCDRLNMSRARDGLAPLSMPRMGRILQGIPTKDLYYLKSICEQAKDFSKKFWWEINPEHHTEQDVPAPSSTRTIRSGKKRA